MKIVHKNQRLAQTLRCPWNVARQRLINMCKKFRQLVTATQLIGRYGKYEIQRR